MGQQAGRLLPGGLMQTTESDSDARRTLVLLLGRLGQAEDTSTLESMYQNADVPTQGAIDTALRALRARPRPCDGGAQH